MNFRRAGRDICFGAAGFSPRALRATRVPLRLFRCSGVALAGRCGTVTAGNLARECDAGQWRDVGLSGDWLVGMTGLCVGWIIPGNHLSEWEDLNLPPLRPEHSALPG